jgi:hypothetical protein
MGGLFSSSSGGGKGGVGGIGGGGLSGADVGLIQQALGQGSQAIHNRYAQLGLGVPSGDPAQAAATGQNLHYAGAGTAEQMDVQGLGQLAQAALGQLQNQNANNPAISGSTANQIANAQNLGNLGGGTQNQSTSSSTDQGTPSVSS